MKTDFLMEIFSDESRASLDACDGWTRVWVLYGNRQSIFQRQLD